MTSIGIACFLDDVDALVALGLASPMLTINSCIFLCHPRVFTDGSSALADELLAEIGLARPMINVASEENLSVEKGLVVAYRKKNLEHLRMRYPHFFLENWELLVVGEAPGGFKYQGTSLHKVIRGQLRDGIQHFFRRTEGLVYDDDALFG
ncbi:MAG: hypothetical protein GY822_05935 [Deltaproteobacteria bacterium]|nr:hypothetical protein [Deltaproteobacteria bacterium]